ncbi:MAG: ABC transporter permease [Phaeobacter italicus]
MRARLAGITGALLLWQLLAWQLGQNLVIAGPLEVATYLFGHSGLLWRALCVTLSSAAQGFLWGNLAAIAMAAIVILAPRVERGMTLLALVVFCLPLVATGPILRVLHGPGAGPQITLAAMAVYYTTYLALLVGLRAIPQSWSDLVAVYGRGRFVELSAIRWRASLPYLTAALQIAAPVAFLGAMVGEFTGAERGLGVLTLRAMRSLDVQATWAIAVVATGASVGAYWLFGWLGRQIAEPRADILLSTADAPKRRVWWHGFAWCLGLILLWYGLMVAFDLNTFFAKRPDDVAAFLLSNDQGRETLLVAVQETLVLTIPGYVAGLILGAGLACALILLPQIAAFVLPLAIALRCVPIITTAPLIILALGRGAVGTVGIVAVMIFFPTLVTCLQGLRQTPGQVKDVFESYASGRWRFLISAQIPSMLPAFFASARMAVPAAILAVTTAEWLATGKGIGNLMALTASTSDYNMLWSAIVAIALVAVVCYVAIERVEQAVLSRYASEQLRR